jgi:uncharacterized delta-60 repeat protein
MSADHKLLFAGTIGYPNNHVFMVRIYPDGTRDFTFGVDGILIDPIDGSSNAYGLALQTDGKILVTGDSGPQYDAIVVRYNGNGTRDINFGEQGVQYFPEVDEGVAIAVKPDGGILTVNWSSNSTLGNLALVQLLPDGQRDPSFGVNGVFRMIDPGMHPRALLLVGNKVTVSARKHTGTTLKQLFRFILDLNVGLQDPNTSADPSLLVYPNPIVDVFTLQFVLNQKEALSVQLHDMQGRLIQSTIQNQPFDPGEHTLSLNCPNHLAAGNYILTLEVAGKKTSSIQIMKR